jgi:hypothetical protein
VISAGEQSRKTGRDKLLLDVCGVSLLCRVQDRTGQKENRKPTAMGRKRSRHASQRAIQPGKTALISNITEPAVEVIDGEMERLGGEGRRAGAHRARPAILGRF